MNDWGIEKFGKLIKGRLEWKGDGEMDGIQIREHRLLKSIFEVNISIHIQSTFKNSSLYFCMQFLFS